MATVCETLRLRWVGLGMRGVERRTIARDERAGDTGGAPRRTTPPGIIARAAMTVRSCPIECEFRITKSALLSWTTASEQLRFISCAMRRQSTFLNAQNAPNAAAGASPPPSDFTLPNTGWNRRAGPTPGSRNTRNPCANVPDPSVEGR